MKSETHYHPTVIISYLILIGVVLWVSLSNRLKQPLDRHADALIKVRPDFFKPSDETEVAA